MGIQAHHNFVPDPEIAGYSVMVRRIPCLCLECLQRFQKPVRECYSNPCNDCKYWTMYLGWNDWRKIHFCKWRDCDIDDHERAQKWTLNKIGKRMVEQIVVRRYGAYLFDDTMKYYLVQWTSDPWIDDDGSLETDGGVPREGEWVCKGLWLKMMSIMHLVGFGCPIKRLLYVASLLYVKIWSYKSISQTTNCQE